MIGALNIRARTGLASLFARVSGEARREREHTRNRLIKQLAENIAELQRNPELVTRAIAEYGVRRPLRDPLHDLCGYDEQEARQVVLSAIDALTSIDPLLAAEFTDDISCRAGTATKKAVNEKILALSGQLPAEKALRAISTVAIYSEDLREQASERFIATAKTFSPADAFEKIASAADNDYYSARITVPALLEAVKTEGLSAAQQARAYRIVAQKADKGGIVQAHAVERWEAIAQTLPAKEGLSEVSETYRDHYEGKKPEVTPLRKAGIHVLAALVPKAEATESYRVAEGMLSCIPRDSVEWESLMNVCTDALEDMPVREAVARITYFSSRHPHDVEIQEELAGVWFDVAERVPQEELMQAIDNEYLHDKDYRGNRTLGAAEQEVLNTWLDMQGGLPPERAYMRACNVVSRQHPTEQVRALKSDGLPQLFLALVDRLPPDQARESLNHVIYLANEGPLAAAVTDKWERVVRALPPKERLTEIYRITENDGIENRRLKRAAKALEKQTCGEVACGMTPGEFLGKVAPQPG